MSRINVGIPPVELCRQHLLAEHREIKRIPNTVRRMLQVGLPIAPLPTSFRLGKGHVRFFYDKLGYLLRRYRKIHRECVRRKYFTTDFSSAWDDIPEGWMGDWSPSEADIALVRERIAQRLNEMRT